MAGTQCDKLIGALPLGQFLLFEGGGKGGGFGGLARKKGFFKLRGGYGFIEKK
jgi:hypothetical protein